MKVLTRFPYLIFLIALQSGGLYSQGQPGEFVSGDGRFAFGVREKPTERKDYNNTLGKYDISAKIITWKLNNGDLYVVEYDQVSGEEPKLTAADKTAFLRLFKNGYLGEFNKAGITTKEFPYIVGDFRGVEIQGIGGAKFVSRMFFADGRFYFLTVAARNVEGFDHQIAMLNTFRYLNKSEYSTALIEENSPIPLPQDISLKPRQSDAQIDGLKGKVREIITGSEKPNKKDRKLEQHCYYGLDGNEIKTIWFMTGYPSEIVMWGWIDGMRVGRSNFIEYGPGEGPNEDGITNIITSVPAETKERPKRDERYSERYVFQFDTNNRIIEKKTYQNDGELWTRDVYVYKPNRTEKITYDQKGKLNSKTVDIYDAAGNTVEVQSFDDNGKLEGTAVYEYQVDAIGNWIVRKESEKTTARGKVVLKPSSTSYRQIIYYE